MFNPEGIDSQAENRGECRQKRSDRMMNSSKTAVAVSRIIATLQMLFGIFFILFGITGIFAYASSGYDLMEVFVVLLFLGVGIWLIVLRTRRQKLLKLFRWYVSILSEHGNGSISNIARVTHTSANDVQANLQKMIDKKYFLNAHIDLNTLCIAFPHRIQFAQAVQTASAAEDRIRDTAKAAPEFYAVTCRGCGGVNRIAAGQVGECEYCGSPIKK